MPFHRFWPKTKVRHFLSDSDYPGVARVSEALQAHMWPCMEMKTESHDRSHDLAESKTQEVKSKASPGDSAAGNTSALEALLEETDCSTASQKEKTQKKIGLKDDHLLT